jgi:hypothetical protein
MSFKKGDPVIWKSQANGYTKEKRGTILVVVPPNTSPEKFLNIKETNKSYSTRQMYDIRPMDGAGYYRSYESYIVEVKQPGNRKPKLYWPRVSFLRRVIT